MESALPLTKQDRIVADWYPVKDAFPPDKQDVLLVHILNGDASSTMSGYRTDGHWFENCYYGEPGTIPEDDVTHWALMPEPYVTKEPES